MRCRLRRQRYTCFATSFPYPHARRRPTGPTGPSCAAVPHQLTPSHSPLSIIRAPRRTLSFSQQLPLTNSYKISTESAVPQWVPSSPISNLHAVLRNKTKKNAPCCVIRHGSLQQVCQSASRPAVAGRSIVARGERGRRNAPHGEQIDKPTRSENVMHGKPHHRHAEQR